MYCLVSFQSDVRLLLNSMTSILGMYWIILGLDVILCRKYTVSSLASKCICQLFMDRTEKRSADPFLRSRLRRTV